MRTCEKFTCKFYVAMEDLWDFICVWLRFGALSSPLLLLSAACYHMILNDLAYKAVGYHHYPHMSRWYSLFVHPPPSLGPTFYAGVLVCLQVLIVVSELYTWFYPRPVRVMKTVYDSFEEPAEEEDVGPVIPERQPPVLNNCGVEPHAAGETRFCMLLPPPWQVSIWADVGVKNLALVGHATRIANHLVANWHVLQTIPLEKLYIAALREGKPDVKIPANTLKWETVIGDICAAPLGKLQLAGVKNASIKHVIHTQLVQVATDLPSANASMGILRNSETWGLVEYSGAVRAGFSGATYYHGRNVYGIHSTGGTAGAMGYSASYVAMKLRHGQSSDYAALMYMLETGADRRYRSRRVSPEDVEVFYDGRYFVIEVDEYQELNETYPEYWDDEPEPPPRRRNRTRRRRRDSWSSSEYSEDMEFHAAQPFVMQQPVPLPQSRVIETQTEPQPEVESVSCGTDDVGMHHVGVQAKPEMVDVGVQTENEEGAPHSVGSPSPAQAPTTSPSQSLALVPWPLISPTTPTSSGRRSTRRRSARASMPIRNIPAEQERELSRRVPQSSRLLTPSSNSAIPSVTPPATRSRRQRRRAGRQSSEPSTLRVPQASVSSPTTRRTQTSSAGTASRLPTEPITRPSSTPYARDFTRLVNEGSLHPSALVRLAHAGVPEPVLNALRTLSSSSNSNPTNRRRSRRRGTD